ncbi:M20 family metallopeptidase [Kineosporia sp. R_H_3]|uniref:M20 metallopeptidase family protein n=1 Tax=Kineosporia sp. R_H_3 TaxID=1961848 RepID=UPI001E64779F|nr:amidohydrolase [Kineosporia sp. R_H_3]
MTGRHAGARAGLEALRRRWVEALDAELPAAVALRHRIHAAPEVSGHETATTAAVVAAIGAGAGTASATTGRVLRIGPGGPAVAVRAELDALPLVEATGATYAATNGAMHACGHDVHLAAVTALARAALATEAAGHLLPAGLLVVLQPREEVGPTGAADVLAEGVLAAHDVRCVVGGHVQPQVTAGHVSCDPGPVNAAVDEIEVVVTGRGGHGAYPHLAVDPVPALCRIVLSMQDALRSAVDPLQPAVVSMTQLSGSGAPNVVPDEARAAGTVRTMRPGDAVALHARIEALVTGIAQAHGCTGTYLVRRGEPALDNDPATAACAADWLAASGLPTAPFASCGSDDFATYGTRLPILMMFVGTGDGPGSPMLHDAAFLPPDGTVREVALALMAGWLAAVEVHLGPGAAGADGAGHRAGTGKVGADA